MYKEMTLRGSWKLQSNLYVPSITAWNCVYANQRYNRMGHSHCSLSTLLRRYSHNILFANKIMSLLQMNMHARLSSSRTQRHRSHYSLVFIAHSSKSRLIFICLIAYVAHLIKSPKSNLQFRLLVS